MNRDKQKTRGTHRRLGVKAETFGAKNADIKKKRKDRKKAKEKRNAQKPEARWSNPVKKSGDLVL